MDFGLLSQGHEEADSDFGFEKQDPEEYDSIDDNRLSIDENRLSIDDNRSSADDNLSSPVSPDTSDLSPPASSIKFDELWNEEPFIWPETVETQTAAPPEELPPHPDRVFELVQISV